MCPGKDPPEIEQYQICARSFSQELAPLEDPAEHSFDWCHMEPEVRKRQIIIWYTVAAVIGVLLFQYLWVRYSEVKTIPYSQFERLLG